MISASAPSGGSCVGRGRQPAGDQVGAAGGAQRVADRDERAEHDQDRPFDRVIGLAQRQRAHQQHDHGGAEERDRHRHDVATRPAPWRRPGPAAAAALRRPRPSRRSRSASGRQPQFAERLRHGGEIALQHDHVAGLQLDRAQPVGDALARAADRQQVDLVALVAAAPAPACGRPAANSAVTTASITPISSVGVSHSRGSCRRARASASPAPTTRSSAAGSPCRSTMSSGLEHDLAGGLVARGRAPRSSASTSISSSPAFSSSRTVLPTIGESSGTITSVV